MMNQTLDLGKDAPTKLPRPDYKPKAQPVTAPPAKKTAVPRAMSSLAEEITFKSVVEEFVASHDLLLVPTGKVEEKSRMPLYRVSKNVEGRGGLLVYILDDAVWTSNGEEYRAIPPDDVIERALKA